MLIASSTSEINCSRPSALTAMHLTERRSGIPLGFFGICMNERDGERLLAWLSDRVFVGRAFGTLRFVVVMAGRWRHIGIAFGIACRIGGPFGNRRGVHAVAHELTFEMQGREERPRHLLYVIQRALRC